MSVLVQRPAGPPSGLVDRVWYVEGAAGQSQTICPDGRTEIVLHLGDPMRQEGTREGAQPRHLLVGQMDRPMTIAPTGRVAVIGATFEGGTLHQLLAAPQDGLAGSVIDLEAVGLDLSGVAKRQVISHRVSYDRWKGARMRGLGLVMVTAVMSMGTAAYQVAATTADLAFMTGCWRLERGGRTTEEHWLAPAGGSLMGISRTVAGGKTVEYEFIQIRDLPDGLTYIAKPSNQPEASFKMSARTADEIVFENPAHDFPQRIRYKRVGADELHARIEGTMNGKSRGMDFPYARVACVP